MVTCLADHEGSFPVGPEMGAQAELDLQAHDPTEPAALMQGREEMGARRVWNGAQRCNKARPQGSFTPTGLLRKCLYPRNQTKKHA